MAKRNRWLVGTVLTIALAAFLSLSLLPVLSGGSRRSPATGESTPTTDPTAVQSELEARARGYSLVLEREPDNQAALQGLVEARIQLGDLEGIVEPLAQLAETNPDVTDYTVLLAQTHQQLGDLDAAAQAYRSILDTQPGNMNALQGLTALLVQQDRPQAAIGLLQDTLATADTLAAPGDPLDLTAPQSVAIDRLSVNLLLAQVYVEDGSVEQAIDLYDRAMQNNPTDFRPVLAKALVLQEDGQPDAAQPLFDQALAMAPPEFKDQIGAMMPQSAAPNDAADPSASPSTDETTAPLVDDEAAGGEPEGEETGN